MRLKFTLIGRENLSNFYSMVHLLSKHGNTIFFVLKKESLTLLLDQRDPFIWIDINMSSYVQTYEFENDENTNLQEELFLEFNMKDLLLGLKFFNKDADTATIKLVKKNYPLLRVDAQISASAEKSPKYRTEIPLMIVPDEKQETIIFPSDLDFPNTIKSPRFEILKKYVEIFKNFKCLRFILREKSLQLHADEVGSRVDTTFDNIIFIEQESDEIRIDATVDAKKLSSYISSIGALHNVKVVNLTLSMAHKKMMKLFFQNSEHNVSFHYVIASNVDEDGDDE